MLSKSGQTLGKSIYWDNSSRCFKTYTYISFSCLVNNIYIYIYTMMMMMVTMLTTVLDGFGLFEDPFVCHPFGRHLPPGGLKCPTWLKLQTQPWTMLALWPAFALAGFLRIRWKRTCASGGKQMGRAFSLGKNRSCLKKISLCKTRTFICWSSRARLHRCFLV